MEDQEIRWKQRFKHFVKAFTLLRSALEDKEIDDFDDLQQEGLVQRFEYTFELLWKTLKDYLDNEEVDIGLISPKNVIKAAGKSTLLERIGADGEILLDMHTTRNLLSHTYDVKNFRESLIKLKRDYLPQIDLIYEYLMMRDMENE